MSNMRIRNMFLLVTALAVMFLLACGQSDESIVSAEAENFVNRGNDLADSGDYKSAIVSFNSAIEIDPSYAKGYYLRGVVYGELNELDLALEDFTQYIVLADPNDPRGYIGRAMVNATKQKGESELLLKIIDDASRAIAMKGNDEALLLDLSPQEIDELYGTTYAMRGAAYWTSVAEDAKKYELTEADILEQYKEELDKAFNDLDKALDLNPRLDEIREMRLRMLKIFPEYRK